MNKKAFKVSFKQENNFSMPLIKAKIDGRDFIFGFDTGAWFNCFSVQGINKWDGGIELYNEAHFAGWPAEKRAHYEKLVMNRNDYENILYENREDAKAEGRMEGHKEGYMEGRMEGHLLMAKKMLEDGIDAERVCRISGLTIEEIMEAAS